MRSTAARWARRTGQAVLARHTLLGSLGWTVVAVLVPTALRLAVDAGHKGAPFVSYFPAVVLAGLFLGWRYAVLTAVLCAGVAWLLFLREMPPLEATPQGMAILGLFVLSCAFLVAIGEWLRTVLAELHVAAAREQLLNEELRHRLKNLLAVVGSLASLSFRHGDPEQARNAFAERLAALDRATGLLSGENAATCHLPGLAEEALRPFLSGHDLRIEGPPQEVDRDACVPAVLALHELATNAIKYGALSKPDGWVGLNWGEPDGGTLVLCWHEHDGPPVAMPQHRGMGSRILSMRSPAASFKVDYAPDGVRSDLALKAA